MIPEFNDNQFQDSNQIRKTSFLTILCSHLLKSSLNHHKESQTEKFCYLGFLISINILNNQKTKFTS